MCWADSLKPIGMPPERSRTSSAKRRKSSSECQSGKRRRRHRRGALGQAPHLGDAARPPCRPGRWPPVPVLAPWPPLKWKACTLARTSHDQPKRAEASS